MAPDPADLIDRAPLGEELARHLAHQIIRHRPPPGTRLVETEICARHGISRSPLREALRLLEHWSLAQRRPRYGVRVAPMSQAHLDDLVTCRIPLEGRAAALVAALPDHAEIARRMAIQLDRMRDSCTAGNADGCFDANLEMMDILHRANPNPVLAGLLNELNKPAQRYRFLVYRFAPDTLGMLIDSNVRLLSAIERNDAEDALRVTEAMVRTSWRDLRDRLPDYLARAAEQAPL